MSIPPKYRPVQPRRRREDPVIKQDDHLLKCLSMKRKLNFIPITAIHEMDCICDSSTNGRSNSTCSLDLYMTCIPVKEYIYSFNGTPNCQFWNTGIWHEFVRSSRRFGRIHFKRVLHFHFTSSHSPSFPKQCQSLLE